MFYYQRSPRMHSDPGLAEIELHRPPAAPAELSFSYVSIVIPVAITAAGAAAMFMLIPKTSGSSYVLLQLVSMSTIAGSYSIPFLMHLQNKKKFRKETQERTMKYTQYLADQRAMLEALSQRRAQLLIDTNPPYADCLEMVDSRSRSVWSRIPSDPDFLKLRCGIGWASSGIHIHAPRQEGIDKDELITNAEQLAAEFHTLTDVPVTVDLNMHRVIGVVGEAEHVQSLIRSLMVQLAVHHSPDEVKIAAFFRQSERESWSWLRWLPHAWDDERRFRYMFEGPVYSAPLMDHFMAVLQRRVLTAKSAPSHDGVRIVPRYVCIVPHSAQTEQESAYSLLLHEADKAGACTIVIAPRVEQLPKECELVIEVSQQESVIRHTTSKGDSSTDRANRNVTAAGQPFAADQVELADAQRLARSMAPYRLRKSSADEIPSVLTLFDLLGIDRIETYEAEQRWQERRFPDSLPAAVGVKGGGKQVMLNLHDKIERQGHGPHGLMAGMTGSGKSEVIQTLIASLAVTYHPHDVTFMLIDYKGGGMSNTFAKLPHVVASITNLEDEGLIERAKMSLKAELERRQKLFVAAGNVQHIDEYYETPWREREPLAHLIIVIDEFAQLKKEQPEFMSELVSIAAIGRTLGVHLLLATQKPAGVVDDNIWSNSRYRICLRVQDEADSREMLKVPDAAYITNPGRGYLQVGTNELFETVQYAWSGAPYQPAGESRSHHTVIKGIKLDGRRKELKAGQRADDVPAGDADATIRGGKQLGVLIDACAVAAERAGIARLRGPWLNPLPQILTLEDLPSQAEPAGSIRLAAEVGLVDDVANQRQIPLAIDVDEGHWIVYGMPGTGKTTFIQTFLYSLALSSTPEQAHAYVLDFSRMLKDLQLLPHVGDVIQEEDEEKVTRLFGRLSQEVARRKQLLADSGTKSRLAYCRETGLQLPALITVIDGYPSFRNRFETEHEQLEAIVREGASLGIYFVLTCNKVSDLMEKVRSSFPNALAFELADPSDYHYAVGRLAKTPGELPPGRGFVKGKIPPLSFQIALAAGGGMESERARLQRDRYRELAAAWHGDKPEPIRTLPQAVLLSEIAAAPDRSDGLTIGLMAENLKPFALQLSDGPYFLIAGPMECGKTSMLTAIAQASASCYGTEELALYGCDFRRQSGGLLGIVHFPQTKGFAADETSLEEMLDRLRQEIDQRLARGSGDGQPRLLLLIDDADLLAKRISASFTITQQLEYILRNGRDLGLTVFAAGQAGELHQSWDTWLKELKMPQTGFLLGSTDVSDTQLFNLRLPYEQTGKQLPAGEGFYIKRKMTRIKAAMPVPAGQTALQGR